MKTNWETIKKRVEMKIGENIDINDFALLANEAIADLNEVAYITAPVKFYQKEDVITEDEEVTYKVNYIDKKLININTSSTHYAFHLPFKYTPGSGNLEIKYEGLGKEDINIIEDNDNVNTETNVVLWPKHIYYKIKDTDQITFTKREMRTTDYESILALPDELSSIIKLEVVDQSGYVLKTNEVSINSLTEDNYDRGRKGKILYYIYDNKIHLLFDGLIKEARLYYTRRMKNVSEKRQFALQNVELENNFENLFTFSICHKWLENFVGTEDAETNNMFQKYQMLKKEYEEKNLPKRSNRRQTRIEII